MAWAKTPSSKSRWLIFSAVADSPTITGVIGVSLAAGVEAEVGESLLEVAGVLPQPLDQLRLLLQHLQGRDAGGRHRGRDGRC